MLKAYDAGVECVGILKGWKGLMENLTIPLKIAEHDDLHTIGGTILYTSRILISRNNFQFYHIQIDS